MKTIGTVNFYRIYSNPSVYHVSDCPWLHLTLSRNNHLIIIGFISYWQEILSVCSWLHLTWARNILPTFPHFTQYPSYFSTFHEISFLLFLISRNILPTFPHFTKYPSYISRNILPTFPLFKKYPTDFSSFHEISFRLFLISYCNFEEYSPTVLASSRNSMEYSLFVHGFITHLQGDH